MLIRNKNHCSRNRSGKRNVVIWSWKQKCKWLRNDVNGMLEHFVRFSCKRGRIYIFFSSQKYTFWVVIKEEYLCNRKTLLFVWNFLQLQSTKNRGRGHCSVLRNFLLGKWLVEKSIKSYRFYLCFLYRKQK